MSKYRDKMRLQKYLAEHNTVSPLIEYLILAGYPDSEVKEVEENGIERCLDIMVDS